MKISIIVSTIVLLSVALMYGQEFSLKSSNDGNIKGPFELKEDNIITLPNGRYILKDSGKYGVNSFTLMSEERGEKYGPFTLKNASSISVNKMSFTMYVVSAGNSGGQKSAETSSVVKGKLNSDKLIKFENMLDIIEENFTQAVKSQKESRWLQEYFAKFNEFKILSRDLQNDVMKVGMSADVNLPKHVLTMQAALTDAREDFKKNGICPFVCSTRRNNRSSGRGGTTENYSDCQLTNSDTLTASRGRSDYRKGKNISLKAGGQDFVLSVAHLRKEIQELEKSGNWNALKRNGKSYRR